MNEHDMERARKRQDRRDAAKRRDIRNGSADDQERD